MRYSTGLANDQRIPKMHGTSDEPKKQIWLSALYGGLGMLFSIVIGFTGLALSGAGHGTSFFGDVVGAPEPYGFLIWPLIGILLPQSDNLIVKMFIGVLVLVNYCAVGALVVNVEVEYLKRTFKALPLVVIFVAFSYFAVQIVILARILGLWPRTPSGHESSIG